MLTRIQMLIWWTTNTMFFYITIPCTRKYTNDRNEHLLCRVSQEALTLMALDMSLLCLCIFVFLYHNTMHQEDRNEHLLCRVSQEALTLMALDMSLLCLCIFYVLCCLLQDCCPAPSVPRPPRPRRVPWSSSAVHSPTWMNRFLHPVRYAFLSTQLLMNKHWWKLDQVWLSLISWHDPWVSDSWILETLPWDSNACRVEVVKGIKI